jgi:hypothetical protein
MVQSGGFKDFIIALDECGEQSSGGGRTIARLRRMIESVTPCTAFASCGWKVPPIAVLVDTKAKFHPTPTSVMADAKVQKAAPAQ